LDEGVHETLDALRLVFRTPNWADFVELAVREIRFYGASNFQIARRLRAMLLTLIANLPDCRKPALALELSLLDSAIELAFPLPEDRFLACRPDTQGLGGGAFT
jgi:uncharacterized membrane protein